MAANDDTPDVVPIDRTIAAPSGETRQISDRVRRIICDNPSPTRFTGTCSYLVGRGRVMLIDPGPDDAAHIGRLLDAVRGETLTHVLITHSHHDHSPGAVAIKAATGAKIVGGPRVSPAQDDAAARSHDQTYVPDIVLQEGDTIDGDGFSLQAFATPGHASNHFVYALPAENALFSGDHVMGWSTTIVAPPDGSIAQYMASLDKLAARSDAIYWPGHGGPVREPQRFVRALARHRRQREEGILARLAAGDRDIPAIVEVLYKTINPALKGAAARAVLGHLVDLSARRLVTSEDGPPTLTGRYRLAG